MDKYLIEILYLVASLSFVIGLKMMGKPDSARKGNLIAAAGMGIAVFGTLFFGKDGFAPIANMGLIMVAIAIGTTIG